MIDNQLSINNEIGAYRLRSVFSTYPIWCLYLCTNTFFVLESGPLSSLHGFIVAICRAGGLIDNLPAKYEISLNFNAEALIQMRRIRLKLRFKLNFELLGRANEGEAAMQNHDFLHISAI